MGLKRVSNTAALDQRKAVAAAGEDLSKLFTSEIDKISTLDDVKAYLKRQGKVIQAAAPEAKEKGRAK